MRARIDITSLENHEFLHTILRMNGVVKHNKIKRVLPLKHTKTQDNQVQKSMQKVLQSKWITFKVPVQEHLNTNTFFTWGTNSKCLRGAHNPFESFCICSINEQYNLYTVYIKEFKGSI